MMRSMALGERHQVAVLLDRLLHVASQRGRRPDRRNMRTFRQLVLSVLLARSTRLLALGRVMAPVRQVQSVKAAAMAAGYFLTHAQIPLPSLGLRLGEAALRELSPGRLVTYHGKVLLVIDPTEYAKRSRGTGTRGRQMQYIGRVRQQSRRRQGAERVATTFGYVDIWAGLVLTGKQFLPLARQLFSSRHPQVRSQNRTEEAVLGQALAVLRRVGLKAIVVGDRGVGRKELMIRLAQAAYDLVMRIDPDITLIPPRRQEPHPLVALLAAAPVLGEVTWERGQQRSLSCHVRVVHGTIRFSRSGRQADRMEAAVSVVELAPQEEGYDSLVLVTTLPVRSLAAARAVTRIYQQRWVIETAFQTMHAWGQDAFMVRSWRAIERLLTVLACAYLLTVLLLTHPACRTFRRQAIRFLGRLSVLGRRLTTGKLAQALSLDYADHRLAWSALPSP